MSANPITPRPLFVTVADVAPLFRRRRKRTIAALRAARRARNKRGEAEQDVLTEPQVASRLKTDAAAVWRWVKLGLLPRPFRRIDVGAAFWRRADVEAFAAATERRIAAALAQQRAGNAP